ncbi:P-loop NTPase family protein [Elizabethkingia meningoseptica]|uniref:ATPase n=1 Tax=Elizabethkingia meningoseptica TaxID=238 RepID=UPI0020121747|nr:ATPase [Elizabethkingia meningoseptica]MCL1674302.1 ATPase [Elizabethkingia meningoseptica]MCL1686077.1 ATPase [Elizabethkingia meningoseptica]
MDQYQTEPKTSTPPLEKTTPSRYDYPLILKMLEDKGKEIFGASFHFQAQDHHLIIQLTAYFLRDQATCDQSHISLDKGILLSGPIGCGKTALITLMRHVTQPVNKYLIKSCRDVSFEFIQDGYEVIHRYSRGKLYEPSTKNYCFDDLGVENNLKYYGNECNIMAEIILSRYDLYITRQLQTHITTNLSASEIEAFYGNRVRSRMRELFNLIAFPNDASDKRK